MELNDNLQTYWELKPTVFFLRSKTGKMKALQLTDVVMKYNSTEKLTKTPNAAAMTEEPNRKNMRVKDVPVVSDSVGISYMHPK